MTENQKRLKFTFYTILVLFPVCSYFFLIDIYEITAPVKHEFGVKPPPYDYLKFIYPSLQGFVLLYLAFTMLRTRKLMNEFKWRN